MRYRTKEDIIVDMSTKKCWNINKDLAIKATQDIPKGRFLIYSTMHYVTIYSIIKAKLICNDLCQEAKCLKQRSPRY